jgi:hypothetical protein
VVHARVRGIALHLVLRNNSSLIALDDHPRSQDNIKYRDLVANAIMLHNVVDMTNVLAALQQEGVCVTPEAASHLSPYLNGHLKRFGQYGLDMTIQPEPLEPKTLFGLRV